MAVLLNEECYIPVVEFGWVSLIILWAKVKFTKLKVHVVVVYGPMEEY